MENTQNANNREYEGIGLRNLVETFLRKKWLVLGITIGAALVALGVSLALPKKYDIKTILEIGTVPDQSQLIPVEDPGLVAKKIDGDFYGNNVRQKLSVSERGYPKLKVDNFSGNLISISTDSSDTQLAKSILKELGNAVVSDYQPRAAKKKTVVSGNIDVQKKGIQQLTDKVQAADSEKKAIEAEVSSLTNEVVYNKDIGLLLALTSDRREAEAKQQDIESLYLQINQNNQQINLMNGLLDQIRPSAVIMESVVSEAPVSPIIWLNAVLGAILGFFAGTCLAFGIEWWKKNA